MKKKLLIAFFFIIISSIIIFSWFKDGYIYGGGDVGLQTYNPSRMLENLKFIWWEAAGPGFPIPQGLVGIPLQFILSLFQHIGFSPLILQAGLFFILLFLMGFGMYLLLDYKLEEKKNRYPIIGGLFYMFNPYMMIQVWHRFVHTTIVLAAALPFLAIFWEKWVREGQVKNLLFFLLTSFLAVYLFGTFAYIITVWVFLSLLTTTVLVPWQGKSILLKVGARFLFGFVIWILINCWWLVPILKISPAVLSEVHRTGESVTTLISISAQAILPYTLQLINPFYLFQQAEFGSIYKNFFFQFIPWIFVVIILFGLVNTFRSKKFSLYGILFLVSVFFAKGAAPPFGAAYIFGFTHFFALGVMRNPFEKTGLMMVFFASVLFAMGLKILSERIKYCNLLIGVVILLLLFFSWPMLLGKLTGKYDKPEYVQVPESYSLADQWLNKQKNLGITDGKVLQLPLTRGEAVQYKWEFGYSGLESSDQLFTAFPSISRGFNIHRIDDSLTALSLIFYKPYDNDHSKILQLLQAFNIRFIVLHKDISFLGTDIYDPLIAEKVLNSLEFVKKKAEFGDIVIYQILDKFFGPKIEIHNNISLVYPQKANMGVWPWLASQAEPFFVSQVQDQSDEILTAHSKETLIFPNNSFSYPEASGSSLEIRDSLNVQLNSIAGTVNYLMQSDVIQTQTEETVQNIILSSNKLIEISKNPAGQVSSLIEDYVSLMKKVFPELDDSSTLYFDISRTTVDDILKIHEIILSYIQSKLDEFGKEKIASTQNELSRFLEKEKSLPHPLSINEVSEVGQRQYYDFLVNSAGRYEMLLMDSVVKNAYVNKLDKVDFQINSERKTLSGVIHDNLISFGMIDLQKGLNEISLTNPQSVNLISTFDNLMKIGDVKSINDILQLNITQSSPAAIESSLGQSTGGDLYQISFEARIPVNTALYLQVIQDSDPEENGQKVPKISFQIPLNQSVPDWQIYNTKLPPISSITREAKVRLIAIMPNDQGIQGTKSIFVRNLRVIRILNNGIFLRNYDLNNIKEASYSGRIINFTEVSPVQYEGRVSLDKAGFIFFKESYHPGWELHLTKGDQLLEPMGHYFGYLYGNVWYIDLPGDYNFSISFKPQETVYLGMLLSGLGLLSIGAYVLIKKVITK